MGDIAGSYTRNRHNIVIMILGANTGLRFFLRRAPEKKENFAMTATIPTVDVPSNAFIVRIYRFFINPSLKIEA